MKRRSLEAEILEQDYFRSLRQSLAPYDPKQANEYLQDAREHVESALAEHEGMEVDAETMKGILIELGDPEEYVQEAFGIEPIPESIDASSKGLGDKSYRKYVFLAIILTVIACFIIIKKNDRNVKLIQPLEVSKVSHVGEVAPNQLKTFQLTFNGELDPKRLVSDAIQWVPHVPGKSSLVEGNILEYALTKPLKGATRYQVILNSKLVGVNGLPVQANTWKINTPAPEVMWIRQSRVVRNGLAGLSIRFNYKVDPVQLKNVLEITDKEKHVLPYRVLTQTPQQTIHIELSKRQWLEVHCKVKAGLVSESGSIPLKNDFTQKVLVEPLLKFLELKAKEHESEHAIYVAFNHNLEIDKLSKYIEIKPNLKTHFKSHYQGFFIKGDFKSGQRYEVTLKAGLPAGAAGELEKAIRRVVWFGDKNKNYGFLLKDGYLTPNHLNGLPVYTMNVNQLELEMKHLLNHNVIEWALRYDEYIPKDYASDLKKIKFKPDQKKNTLIESTIDLKPHLDGRKYGVYYFNMKDKRGGWSKSTFLTLTDLGISLRKAKKECLVWVMSLSQGKPIEKARVRLVDAKRRIIADIETDSKGLAKAPLNPDKFKDLSLIVVEKGEDLSFLNVKKRLKHRNIKKNGIRPYLDNHYEVFGFSERGIYRAGDKVHVSGFIRGQQWVVPESFPLSVTLLKPNGTELKKKMLSFDQQGRFNTNFSLPNHAMSGKYNILYALPGKKAKRLGQHDFLVRDFIPQTLKMKVAIQQKKGLLPGHIDVHAHVKHLFGKPAKGLKTQAFVKYLSAPISFPKYKNFQFGQSRKYEKVAQNRVQSELVNEGGNVKYKFFPNKRFKSAQTRVEVKVVAHEKGGRTLTEYDEWTYPNYRRYLGLKNQVKRPQLKKPTLLEWMMVSSSGNIIKESIKTKVQLFKVDYQYVLRKKGRRGLQYVWESKEKLVQSFDKKLNQGVSKWSWVPEESGEYRLIIEGDGAYALEQRYYVKGKGMRWSMQKGESLKLNLDRRRYVVGDKLECDILSPFDGEALVTIETNRILSSQLVSIKKGKAKIHYTVKDSWRPNVFISATILRPVKPEDSWQPYRLMGTSRILVDSPQNKLEMKLHTEKQAKPGSLLPVELQLSHASGNVNNASVVLFAVDEGILNITRYPSPDPRDFFYAPRQIGVREYDMYDQVSPILKKWNLLSSLKPGGGLRRRLTQSSFGRHLSQVTAKRVKAAVVYQGLLKSDEQGKVKANLQIPEYIGELRLMAVAADKDRFASLDQSIPVLSSVMAKSSWPRFLAPHDEVEVAISLFNTSKESGNVQLSFEIDGPLQILEKPDHTFIKSKEDKTVFIKCKAGTSGVAKVKIKAQLNEHVFSQSIECPVRPAVKFKRDSEFKILKGPGIHQVKIRGQYLKGTEQSSLIISSFAGLDLVKSANALLKYPYGCAEQTTSKLIPLVYMHDLMELLEPNTVSREEIEDRIQAGLRRLSLMQTRSGGLSMWPGSYHTNPFISVYAAYVLLEIKHADYKVPEHLLNRLLGYIRSHVDDWCRTDFKHSRGTPGEAAFGLYVLSKANQPLYTWMSYLENKFDQLKKQDVVFPASAEYYLAAAQALTGHQGRFDRILQSTLTPLKKRVLNGFWPSPFREKAIKLSMLLDFKPKSESIPFLAKDLRLKLKKSNLSTQENAFAIFALGKYARLQGQDAAKDIQITLANGEKKKIDPSEGLRLNDVKNEQVFQIEISGNGNVYTYWASEGVPVSGKAEEKDVGIRIRRRLLDPDSNQDVDLNSLIQGKIYHIHIDMEAQEPLEHLVISDLLAAGLEFEKSKAKTKGMSVQFVENKDDRTLVFCSLLKTKASYTYKVRAVTRGSFVLPAVDVACMYDPGIYSTHGYKKLKVKAGP